MFGDLKSRLSSGNLSPGSIKKSGGGNLKQEHKDLVAYNSALAATIKGLEKAITKIEDKTDMQDAFSSAGSDVDTADLRGMLNELVHFQERLKYVTESLRSGVSGNVLAALKSEHASLKDAVAAFQSYNKAVEAVARDEKANETRHTPESKSKLQASQGSMTSQEEALSQKIQQSLPQVKMQLKQTLLDYLEAYTTFFSEGLELSNRVKEGIQKGPAQGPAGAGAAKKGFFGSSLQNACGTNAVPEFLTSAIRQLELKGLNDVGMFKTTPPQAYEALRTAIEARNYSFERANTLALASCLLAWVKELPDILLGDKMFDKWVQSVDELDTTTRIGKMKTLLWSLPEKNRLVLERLLGLFEKVVQSSRVNGLSATTPTKLSAVWGPVLLRPSSGSKEQELEDASAACVVVFQLIVSYRTLFELGADAPKAETPKVAEKVVEAPKIRALEPSKAAESPKTPAFDSPKALPVTPAKTTPSTTPVQSAKPTQTTTSANKSPTASKASSVPPVAIAKTTPGVKTTTNTSSVARSGLTQAPAAKGPKNAKSPRAPAKVKSGHGKGPVAARKLPARPTSGGGMKSPGRKGDSFEDLDSSGEGDENGGGFVSDDGEDGVDEAYIPIPSNGADIEDMQTMGLLGMFLSPESKANLSSNSLNSSANTSPTTQKKKK